MQTFVLSAQTLSLIAALLYNPDWSADVRGRQGLVEKACIDMQAQEK